MSRCPNIDDGVQRAWARVGRAHQPPRQRWRELRRLDFTKDELAFRWYFLRAEGRHGLINAIFGHHGRPNRY